MQRYDEESASLLNQKLPINDPNIISPKSNTRSPKKSKAGNKFEPTVATKTFAFLALVVVQGSHILTFKLSQRGGKYGYNTASAIAVTEAVKFAMSFGLSYAYDGKNMPGPSRSMIGSYFLLALAYAINNQFTFLLLEAIGTAQFSFVKALSPMITAVLMWAMFHDPFNNLQLISLLFAAFGVMCIFGAPDGGIQPWAISALILATCITVLTSIFNSKLLQRGGVSMHVQNMLLYSQGFCINILFYYLGFNATGHAGTSSGFFDGYQHWGVIGLLIAQSTLGIVISAVYKYGDAVIKCLAKSAQAALLMGFDVWLFGITYNFQSFMGSAVVLLSMCTYFIMALPQAARDKKDREAKAAKGELNDPESMLIEPLRKLVCVAAALLMVSSASHYVIHSAL